MDDQAVSSVTGTILLIAMTVVMFSVLALALQGLHRPTDQTRGDIEYTLDAGPDRTWETGDERVSLHHAGGEPLLTADTLIRFEVDGVQEDLPGATLDQGFQDGRFHVGESWVRTGMTVPPDAEVIVRTILVQEGRLHSEARLRPGPFFAGSGPSGPCPDDATPPIVALWTQTPPDVSILSVGGVTVRVALQDDCAGTDDAVAPHLWYRINDGSDPVFVDAGAMTLVGIHTWEGTIPVQLWGILFGQDLEYKVGPLVDLRGNSGESPVQVDPVTLPGITDPGFSYVDTDCDGVWDAGEPNVSADIADGDYQTPDCLVIPASQGDITVNGGDVDYEGKSVFVDVDLRANGGGLSVASTGGALILTGTVDLTANGDSILLHSQGGPIVVEGADLDTNGDSITMIAEGGGIYGSDLEARASHNGDIRFTAEGDIDLQDSDLDAQSSGSITVTFDNPLRTLYIQGADIHDQDDTLRVAPLGSRVDGTPESGDWGY